jgi:type II secretion system protein G
MMQIAAALGLVISFLIIVASLSAEPWRNPERLHYMFCVIQVDRLKMALEEYRFDCGEYPQKLQALVTNAGVAGWRGPYIKELRLDPWGRPFVYRRSADSVRVEIFSYGADGKPGGDFFNTDISSRDLRKVIPQTPSERRAHWLLLEVWIDAVVCFVCCIFALRKTSPRLAP